MLQTGKLNLIKLYKIAFKIIINKLIAEKLKIMSGGGKGEIEAKLEAFVKKCFDECGLDVEKDSISQEAAQKLIENLMIKYNHHSAWDEQEFNRMFDLFQEDGEDDEGLDS